MNEIVLTAHRPDGYNENMTEHFAEEDNSAGHELWLRFWCRVVAGVEIVGGLVGLYEVMFSPVLGSTRVILLLSFVLFVASLWGGLRLAFGKANGVAVSLVVQTAQLFQVSTSIFLYSFMSGIGLIVGGRPEDEGWFLGLSWFYGAKFLLFVNPTPSDTITGVNMVAVLAIVCLLLVRAERLKQAEVPDLPRPVHETGVWPPPPTA